MNYRIQGGKTLSGSVATKVSKNAAVALLCASLLNRGRTTLRKMPKIEEVKRLIEVLESIGVQVSWEENGDMTIVPGQIDLSHINAESAGRTRAIAMFAAPLSHLFDSFELPAPQGCDLGKRSLGAHVDALARLGIDLSGDEEKHTYRVNVGEKRAAEIVMYEASDTGVENVLMAAAKIPGTTTIKFASANYMVQDLCFFLEACGVTVEGIGTTTLVIHGRADIDMDVEYAPSEDPIESMFFISLAATTKSELRVERSPIDFLELELLTLESMGLEYSRGPVYLAENGRTRLVDLNLSASEFSAPPEKIAARPYPGINADNLPFFVPVATQAKGETLIHDWMYDGRAKYYAEMNKLGARVELLDIHRALIGGPTKLHSADIESLPALRPTTMLLIGMLAAEGESMLRNVYPISRGYENLHARLKTIGASIEALE